VTGLQSSSADVGNDGDFAVTAMLTYGDNLLVLDTPQNAYNAVDTRQVLVLGGAYAFGKRFEAGARMPMYLQSGQATGKQDEMFQVDKINSVSRGDATIHAKMNGGATEMFGGDVSYGGLFALSIPTRSGGEFAGTNMPQARLLGLATLTKGRFTYQVNAGAIIRSKEVYSSYVQRSAATFAVGASYRLADKVWLGGEVFGNLIPGGHIPDTDGMTEPAREWEKPIEALGELTYRMSRTAVLALAVGRGLTDGVGTSNVRGALMFSFTPGAEEIVPLPKKIHVEGPNDKDGDGVKDKLDACANEPEDMDLFEDGDGCPDLDNDNDSITDDKDKCATDAEDRDRFQDDDGCPERDNDNDGVLDEQDKCPVAAEDKDGFQDSDGCADPDNDGDGIVDKADKCPQEAEAINGNADDDGCPDRGDSLVVISPDRLDLLDNVQFDGNGSKISRASKNILGQIGATLRAHPELVRIRLTAHVQPTSNTARDLKLSEERAKAVREWLVDWGIDPLRLQSSGFGGTKPLVDPKSKGAQSINDRFELIILERK
jgi:outer membrane protein OmpA-like peptidoglycan-associated protein